MHTVPYSLFPLKLHLTRQSSEHLSIKWLLIIGNLILKYQTA